MKKLSTITFFAGLALLAAAFPITGSEAANSQDANNPYRIVIKNLDGAESTILARVLEASTGLPLAGATVMVGDRINSPFADNIQTTNANGSVEFRSDVMADAGGLNITAAKKGYQALTVLGSSGHSIDFYLMANPNAATTHFLRGNLTGWPTGIANSKVEMGLFLPAFRASTMVNFNLDEIISSYQEQITVMGYDIKVPGNLVLPAQDKIYSFFTVHLEKPLFNMPLAENSQSHMAGILGNAPIKGVVTNVQNKNYLGAINLVDFTRTNWTGWQTVTAESSFDIALNKTLAGASITSSHGNVPSNLDLVAVSLVDPTGAGQALVPMDIKAKARAALLESAPIRDPLSMDWLAEETTAARTNAKGDLLLGSLATEPNGTKSYVFSAVLDQAQFAQRPMKSLQFSAALSPVTFVNGKKIARTDKYLGLITLKSVSADHRTFEFELAETANLKPDYLVFNLFAVAKDEVTGVDSRRVLWTSLLPADARKVSLPNMPEMKASGETQYWEVIAIRRKVVNAESMWDSLVTIENLEQLSHAIQVL